MGLRKIAYTLRQWLTVVTDLLAQFTRFILKQLTRFYLNQSEGCIHLKNC